MKNCTREGEGTGRHDKSEMHKESCAAHAIFMGLRPSIIDTTIKQSKILRQRGRKAMIVLFDTVRTLTRQGISFRGHEANEGGFKQSLYLVERSGCEFLREWLVRKTDWTSAESQNIMIETLYRLTITKIRNCSDFGILVDKTSDITNNEQMSVCIRIVPNDFVLVELFLGFTLTKPVVRRCMEL